MVPTIRLDLLLIRILQSRRRLAAVVEQQLGLVAPHLALLLLIDSGIAVA